MVARSLRLSRDIAGLAGWLALCLGVSGLGGAITATSVGTWYQTLARPPFNPPDQVFAPVWISLFVLMALAAWLVWRRVGLVAGARPLGLFGLQLGLNLLWSALFFGLRAPGWAMVEILFLWAAIAATTLAFRPVSSAAALLLIPYLLWVSFAIVLNASVWWLN